MGINKEYLGGVDLFKIILACITLAFHSNLHFGCTYGVLDPFIKLGAVSMTGFFMVSGFSLYYTYEKRNMFDCRQIRSFYLKRLSNIIPGYYFAALIDICFFDKSIPIKEQLLLAPMGMFGIQSLLPVTWGFSHFGGTWFISCIICCYIVFPYVIEMVKKFGIKERVFALVVLAFILIYAPVVSRHFGLVIIYINPFVRMLEFIMGILCGSILSSIKKRNVIKIISSPIVIAMEWVIMIVFVILASKSMTVGYDYFLSSWICMPLFVFIILGMACIKLEFIKKRPHLLAILKGQTVRKPDRA